MTLTFGIIADARGNWELTEDQTTKMEKKIAEIAEILQGKCDCETCQKSNNQKPHLN